jgi:hypothetical protein
LESTTSPLSFIPGPIFEAAGAGALAAGAGAGAGVDEVEAGAGAGELLELDEPIPKVPQPVATAATAATENRSFAFISLLNEKRADLAPLLGNGTLPLGAR